MCMNKPKVPDMPKPTPPPPVPVIAAPIEADTSVQSAGDDERRRRAAATGKDKTILTSGQGATGQAQTGNKTKLGE